MNAEASRILRNPDLSIIEKMAAFAALENQARMKRDGVLPYFPGGSHPNRGKICEKTRAVLDAIEGEVDTFEIGKRVGIPTKEASGALQRLQSFGLVSKIGVRRFLTPTGKTRLNVWRVTEEGEAYRNG